MKLLTGALGLLFPVKCPFCQTILEDPEAPLCPECQTRLPWLLGREAERKDFLPMSPALFKTLKQRLSAPKSGNRKSPTDGVTAVRANVRTPLYMSAI